MFSNFNYSNSPLCCTCPCSHMHEQVNIYVSQFMYIYYMTSDLFPFPTASRLFIFTEPFLFRSKYQSVSPCIYNTTSDLFRYRPFFFFQKASFYYLPFAASWLSRYLRYSLPLCIGSNPSFAISAKVCFRVQSYGVRTLHKKRLTIFGEF